MLPACQAILDRALHRFARARGSRGRLVISALTPMDERMDEALRNIDAIIIYRADGASPLILNQAVERILGVPSAQVDSVERWLALVHPDDAPRCRAAWSGEAPWELLYRARRSDGEWVWLGDRGHALSVGRREPGLFCVVVNVTERVEAAGLLRRSEARMRAVMDSAYDAILSVSPDDRIIACNASAERLGRVSAGQLVGVPVLDLVAGSDRQRIAHFLAEWRGREDETAHTVVELNARRLDGSEFVAEASVASWHEGGEPFLTAIVRDLTPRKAHEAKQRELEARLARAERLEALGQLAGGVAHDFNNILTAILLHASSAEASMAPGSAAREDVRQVVAAADRASRLTRQLLAFGRRQRAEPEALDLRDVVDGFAPMLRMLLGDQTEVHVAHGAELGAILADRGQIEQVLLNLALNARDAMPHGGVLHIETANVAAGRRVRLSVADTGTGMDEAVQHRIFEPFFTTKEHGKGTGLGLATVYGIVTGANGLITVRSALGVGTTFTIDFPQHAGRVAVAPALPSTAEQLPSGPALNIMLVDDDATVRHVVQRTLERLGHWCRSFAGGLAALEVLARREFVPDLLVSDVNMPGIRGPELAQRARRLIPELPAIMLTGGPDPDVDDLTGLGRCIVVSKPPRPSDLTLAIRRVTAETPR